MPLEKLVLNTTACKIYSTPQNYSEMKRNIEEFGVIQPLLVNRNDLKVISGNLRLQISIELGFKTVPVEFRDLNESEMEIFSLSCNQQREKSYLDKYNELAFTKKFFSIKQGSRADINPQLKEETIMRTEMQKGITTYEKNSFVKIEKLCKKIHGENFQSAVQKELDSLDLSGNSLNSLVLKLEKVVARKRNSLAIPKHFEIIEEDFKVFNHTCETMTELEDKCVQSVVTSPPYFQMRDYGTGKKQIGLESQVSQYIQNMVNIFSECRRVLKDDGSLFVNLNEKVEDGAYRAVCYQFVIEMIKNGWRLNDEIIWLKNNSQYTNGKRTVRSHEYIFHFVKSDSKDFYYNEGLVESCLDGEGSYIVGEGQKFPKFLSGMDFNGRRLRTNVSNTCRLRNQCNEEGFDLTHSATFPVELPGLLVLLSTKPGDLVVDLFNGTGSVGEVCKVMGRKYVGYELNPEFIMATKVRMKNSIIQMNILRHDFNRNQIRLSA
jgi:site-specific DNA-methyltransferase (adenine-specific)